MFKATDQIINLKFTISCRTEVLLIDTREPATRVTENQEEAERENRNHGCHLCVEYSVHRVSVLAAYISSSGNKYFGTC